MPHDRAQSFEGLEVVEVDLGVAQVLDEAVNASHEDQQHAAIEGYEHQSDWSGLYFCARDAVVEDAGEQKKSQYND